MVMDILVELSDKNLVNVEMQRIGYDFPSARCFCYSTDLMVRQYDLIRAEKGDIFSYRDIRLIYVIVLMESSSRPFHKVPNQYIHRSNIVYDTGLKHHYKVSYIPPAYQEIIRFCYHPKELITMYSEALKIMEQNTVLYMVDELKNKLKNEIKLRDDEISQRDAVISQKDYVISKQDAEIQRLREELAQRNQNAKH